MSVTQKEAFELILGWDLMPQALEAYCTKLTQEEDDLKNKFQPFLVRHVMIFLSVFVINKTAVYV
jgi:hypothetical protein